MAAAKDKPATQQELLPSAPAAAPVEVLQPGEGPEGAALEIMERGNIHGIEKFQPLEITIRRAVESVSALVIQPEDSQDVKARKMEEANRLRMEVFRASRLAAEKLHRELKSNILETGRSLDKAEREIRMTCIEMEKQLKEIEEYAVRERDRIEQALRETRAAEISPYLTGPLAVDLGKIDEAAYQSLLSDTRDLYELREKRKQEEDAERERERLYRLEEEEKQERERQQRLQEESDRRQRLQEERDRLAAALEAQKQRANTRRESLGDAFAYLSGCDLGTASDEEFAAAAEAAVTRMDEAKAKQAKDAVRTIRRAEVTKLGLSRYFPDALTDFADPTDDEWKELIAAAKSAAQRAKEDEERIAAQRAELDRQRREIEAQQAKERQEQERIAREEQERLARIAAAGDSALIEEYAKAIDAVSLPKLASEALELNIRGQMVRVIAWLNQKAADMKGGE
jgi:hypothetical protein